MDTSVKLEAIIACGRVGWFKDFSRQAAAHEMSLSRTSSKVLSTNSKLFSRTKLPRQASEVSTLGAYLVFRRTKTTTSEYVYSNRGYSSITAYSRVLVSGEFAHSIWIERPKPYLLFSVKPRASLGCEWISRHQEEVHHLAVLHNQHIELVGSCWMSPDRHRDERLLKWAHHRW